MAMRPAPCAERVSPEHRAGRIGSGGRPHRPRMGRVLARAEPGQQGVPHHPRITVGSPCHRGMDLAREALERQPGRGRGRQL